MDPTSVAPVDGPNINLLSLRADVYRLLCLLVADETVNAVELFREAGHQIHEEEVNRLLIWIAVATRQLFDLDGDDEDRECGRLWRRYPSDDVEPLTFRKACDKVIHASEIVAYPLPEDADADGDDVRSTTRPLRRDNHHPHEGVPRASGVTRGAGVRGFRAALLPNDRQARGGTLRNGHQPRHLQVSLQARQPHRPHRHHLRH